MSKINDNRITKKAKAAFLVDLIRKNQEKFRYLAAKQVVCDDSGNSPVHLAAIYGLQSVIAALSDVGFDVNAVDQNDVTPLMRAARNGEYESAKVLTLECAANVSLLDSEGRSALSYATSTNISEVKPVCIAIGMVGVSAALPFAAPFMGSAAGYMGTASTVLDVGAVGLEAACRIGQPIIYPDGRCEHVLSCGHSMIRDLLITRVQIGRIGPLRNAAQTSFNALQYPLRSFGWLVRSAVGNNQPNHR
jgi:hypothetical protein